MVLQKTRCHKNPFCYFPLSGSPLSYNIYYNAYNTFFEY